jgi:hypothetical protein
VAGAFAGVDAGNGIGAVRLVAPFRHHVPPTGMG